MVILILTIFIIFSGCVEENNITQSTEPVQQEPGNPSLTTLPPREENIPEMKVTSFSSIYAHDNFEKVDDLYLFSWDNVPGSENQRLINYLTNDLGISWAKNSNIIKTDDNKTIRVFTSRLQSSELTLENNKSMVLTTIDYGSPSSHTLKIKEENGKLCVYKLMEDKPGYNITGRYYAVYNLSIKNSGSSDLDFKSSDLHVHDGEHIFNITFLRPVYPQHVYPKRLEVLSDLENKNKIEDTTIFPGQTINGSVVFQVNSLYNESFLLMYKEIPVTSASFEKSIEAMRIAERFNYSVAFGIPPYLDTGSGLYPEERSSFEPNLDDYPIIWPNWINRSIFEFFNGTDSESVLNSPPDNIPESIIVYALEVIPERNITILLVKTKTKTKTKFSENLLVVNDAGDELINTSWIERIAVLRNQTYELHPEGNIDIPQMNLSNATIVRISFEGDYGWPMGMRFSHINQDVILDDEHDITVARYYCGQFLS